VVEIFNRKRATSGASAKTFETLLGLEMRPRLRREATLMWQQVVTEIGKDASDALWSHPDQMPTSLEIENPDSLISRIRNGGDDFEDELRKFLTD
jgi:uncharacterized protein (DUF2342 family)